jgi:hypothetical protein
MTVMSDLNSPGSLPGNADSKAILDDGRRQVEIETPTEASEQVNRLATSVADGYRDLPATIERVAGRDSRRDGTFTAPHTATLDGLGVDGKGAHTHYEQMYISSIEPRARRWHWLGQTLR